MASQPESCPSCWNCSDSLLSPRFVPKLPLRRAGSARLKTTPRPGKYEKSSEALAAGFSTQVGDYDAGGIVRAGHLFFVDLYIDAYAIQCQASLFRVVVEVDGCSDFCRHWLCLL